MTQTEFRVGDKVRIKKTSEYFIGTENNPKHISGEITSKHGASGHIWRVLWSNGYENSYRRTDLELVEEINKTQNNMKKEFIIGTRDTKVIVQRGSILARGQAWNAAELEKLVNIYSRGANTTIGGFDIRAANENLRTIRIGCLDDNNVFSLAELKKVLSAYNNLNR